MLLRKLDRYVVGKRGEPEMLGMLTGADYGIAENYKSPGGRMRRPRAF